MNFDLIEKLIRLANNNPNEHEANLAARKVCRFLNDHKFHETIPVTPRQHQAASEPFNPFEHFDFGDIFREIHKRYPFPQEQREGSWSIPKEDSRSARHQKWPGGEPFKKPSEQQKEERLLKCKTCKNSKLTKFVGLPELYEYNTCQWTAYEQQAKQK